jgi:hypothetical protein
MSKQAEIASDPSVSSAAPSGATHSLGDGADGSCSQPSGEFEEFELDDIEEIESKVFA